MILYYNYRLGISYPELTEMQARAIFEAAIAMSNQGVNVFPEIMVPLVGTPQACTVHNFYQNPIFTIFNISILTEIFLLIIGTWTPSDFDTKGGREGVQCFRHFGRLQGGDHD